ncbi:MAG: TraR/DksA C4-type zinc finger protein [Verrucomicrobiota bacterium]|nr:TraR/DksA C4-type zinc finger protein [Verrucomicrobiota bacterium]
MIINLKTETFNKRKEFMEQSDKVRYQRILEDNLSEVQQYLKSSENAAAAVEPDKSLGRLSRMEAMQDQQLVMEMRRRKKRQLAEIKSALSKIEMGNYGVCIFCGKKINAERLEVSPESQTCIRCT